MPPEKLAFQNQFMAFLWLVPALIATPAPEIKDVGTIWMALGVAGILCTGVAYLLYFRILQEVGPVPSSSVGFLIPCFAMLWSFLFLGEAVNVAHLIGLGCIILAVKWIQPVRKVIDLANH
jgi:drug/metabolite transporter (DMT)-like permease